MCNIVENKKNKFNLETTNKTIISRKYHCISRKQISKNALNIIYKLNKAGYKAYFVGGCIRDLLLGNKPKDFDITTEATPEQICRLFRNCRIIGKRFKLVHVIFQQEIIEVATFRSYNRKLNHKISKFYKDNILLQDNIFGYIEEEDVYHRDFTINGIYYNAIDFTLHDYVGGIKDIENGLIRLIGDPDIKFREDPVRMLRAIRFAAKLNMHISKETAEPIKRLSNLISYVSPNRLFEELLKSFQDDFGYQTYKLLKEYNLFQLLFPCINSYLIKRKNKNMENIISKVFKKKDYLINRYKYTNIKQAFLFAAIFWYPLIESIKHIKKTNDFHYYYVFLQAVKNFLKKTCNSIAIPKRITSCIYDIYKLQLLMSSTHNQYKSEMLKHPKFSAAYDFLSLRAEIENKSNLKKLVKWWNRIYVLSLRNR